MEPPSPIQALGVNPFPRGGGVQFLIWLLLVCAAEQGMIFRVLSLTDTV